MFLLYCLSQIESPEEKSKFETLYCAHCHTMLHVANRIVKDHGLAEDAVQEAFLRVLHHLEKIDDPISHNTKGFMVIIVRNISINMYNKRSGRAEMPLFDNDEEVFFVASPDPEVNQIAAAIMKLPELYANTLTLRYLHDFNDKECAQLLKISEVALRKRLERGRTLLKEHLTREEGVALV